MERKHPLLPDPLPFSTLSSGSEVVVSELFSDSKVTVTERSLLMSTSQVGLSPEQAPLQPLNTEPLSELAVRVTVAPC